MSTCATSDGPSHPSAAELPAERRMRPRVALGVAIVVATIMLTNGRASANLIAFAGSMEGAQDIDPGDWIAVGYYLRINGAHPATTIFMVNATVTLPVAGEIPQTRAFFE